MRAKRLMRQMKRNNSILLVILLLLGCSSKSVIQRKEGLQFDSFKIIYVDFRTSTLIRINCGQFEEVFADDYRTAVTRNELDLKKMRRYLSAIQISNKNSLNVDTRMKVKFFSSNIEVAELCVDQFHMTFNGESINYNTKLRDYLLGFFIN